jgi:hypothetical protein
MWSRRKIAKVWILAKYKIYNSVKQGKLQLYFDMARVGFLKKEV